MVKMDRNPDYNMYYTSNGERLDEGVCEAVDTNYYYGKWFYPYSNTIKSMNKKQIIFLEPA